MTDQSGTKDASHTDPVAIMHECMTAGDIQELYADVLKRARSGNSSCVTFMMHLIKLIDARDVSHDGDSVIRPPHGLTWDTDADGMPFTDGDGDDGSIEYEH